MGKLVIIDGIVAFDNTVICKWGDVLPLKGDGNVEVRCVRTGNFAYEALGIGAGRKVKGARPGQSLSERPQGRGAHGVRSAGEVKPYELEA